MTATSVTLKTQPLNERPAWKVLEEHYRVRALFADVRNAARALWQKMSDS